MNSALISLLPNGLMVIANNSYPCILSLRDKSVPNSQSDRFSSNVYFLFSSQSWLLMAAIFRRSAGYVLFTNRKIDKITR